MPVEIIDDDGWTDEDTREHLARVDDLATYTGRPARHPTRVTADRIGDHMEKYADQLTPLELAACEKVCRAFADIAEGRRV